MRTATIRVHCSSRQRTTPLGAPNWQGLGSPFPAAAPNSSRLRVSTRSSLQNSIVAVRQHLRAARRQPAIFILGSRQTSNALALQASLCGSVTSTSHQPSLATQWRARAVAPKRAARRRTHTSAHANSGSASHFGLVAQSADRPVVCGRVLAHGHQGATPFGSANLVQEPASRNGFSVSTRNMTPVASLQSAGANSA